MGAHTLTVPVSSSSRQFRGVFAGKVDNLKLLLSRFPELASKVNQAGTTACHFACMLSKDQGQ